MIKFTILLRRNPALTHQQFVDYHRTSHATLFMSVPAVREHVRRYVQQATIDVTLPGPAPTTIDGITELWFDDVESVGKVFTDATYLELIRPDEAKFLDLHGCEFIISEEKVVHEENTAHE